MESIQIVEVHEIPLTYIPNNTVRLKVKAVGDLASTGLPDTVPVATEPQVPVDATIAIAPMHDVHIAESQETVTTTAVNDLIKPTDTPKSKHIDATTGDWIIDQYDIECIAVGAGILGCGGGGNPALGRLRCLQALKQGYEMRVINSDR